MPMTTGQIAGILSGLSSTSRHDAAIEKRRRAIRLKLREMVTIIPFQEGVARTAQTATMVDFSSRGVALHFPRPIIAGAHFVLVLPSVLNKPLQLLCDVVHCRKRSDGKFATGAEFGG